VRFLADYQSSLYDQRMYGSSFVAVGVLFSVSLLVHNLRSHSFDRTEPSKLDEPAAMFQPSKLDELTKPKIEEPPAKPQCPKVDGRSGIEVTGAKFDCYVSAIRAWEREYPGTECPASIDELTSYIEGADSLDGWGHPMKLLCGPTIPAHPPGLTIVSAGADGRFGTADDLEPF
jgi:hypothetical protein